MVDMTELRQMLKRLSQMRGKDRYAFRARDHSVGQGSGRQIDHAFAAVLDQVL